MQYRHFSIEEREKIQELIWQKASMRGIAKVLGRSVSSVCREIKRHNSEQPKRYNPRRAQIRAFERRKSRGRKDRLKNDVIRKYVISHLKEKWSPEQISGRMKKDGVGSISHEAIYQYVYAQVHRDGWGVLRPGKEDLRGYLRRCRKRRMMKGFRRSQRVLKPHGPSIEDRPKIVKSKKRVGDWEGDMVMSKGNRPGVNTLLERKTGMYFITRVKEKTGAATNVAISKRMEVVPQKFKHTLTLDNGTENSAWVELEILTGLKTFFAHPYCSGERGANENTNGLLRDYFPKKTDFSMISDEVLAVVEQKLNSRPRKRLGWMTPLEAWSVALQS
jgi:IS30 family transposase